jgi:hypothetical protein
MYTVISVVIILFLLAWYFLPSSGYIIYNGDGNKQVQSVQPKVTQFSYTCWIRIDSFPYGKQQIIFVKGTSDLEESCPALLIDGNTNTLLVKLDTFTSQETIPIVNVPAKKWLHIGITVDEDDLKVYVNGVEYSHKLIHIPKTNSGQLITSPNKGFSGKISKLQFYSKVLSSSEMIGQSKDYPELDEKDQVFPPYFSTAWFKN